MNIKMRNDREGAVLVMVLIVFLVLSILTMSVINMVSNNTRQIVVQKENMQAYYLAMSGVEIGYAALVKYNSDNASELVNASTPTVTLKEDLLLDDAGGKITSITITRDADMIKISAEAFHNESGTTATAKMEYPVNNPYLREWSR